MFALFINLNRITQMNKLKVPNVNPNKRITGIIPFSTCNLRYEYGWDWGIWCRLENWMEDDIPLTMIKSVLRNVKDFPNLKKGWQKTYKYHQNQRKLFEDDDWKWFHARRIAGLINEIEKGCPLNPISVVFSHSDDSFHIYDGNHRIRALQYLEYEGFPCVIYVPHTYELMMEQLVDEGYLIQTSESDPLFLLELDQWGR